jgi:hypothetical protein
LKLPETLIIAAAEHSRADRLITTDRDWPTAKVTELTLPIEQIYLAEMKPRPSRLRDFRALQLGRYERALGAGPPGYRAVVIEWFHEFRLGGHLGGGCLGDGRPPGALSAPAGEIPMIRSGV